MALIPDFYGIALDIGTPEGCLLSGDDPITFPSFERAQAYGKWWEKYHEVTIVRFTVSVVAAAQSDAPSVPTGGG